MHYIDFALARVGQQDFTPLKTDVDIVTKNFVCLLARAWSPREEQGTTRHGQHLQNIRRAIFHAQLTTSTFYKCRVESASTFRTVTTGNFFVTVRITKEHLLRARLNR